MQNVKKCIEYDDYFSRPRERYPNSYKKSSAHALDSENAAHSPYFQYYIKGSGFESLPFISSSNYLIVTYSIGILFLTAAITLPAKRTLPIDNILSARSVGNHRDRVSDLLLDKFHVLAAVLRKLLVTLDTPDFAFPARKLL